jgi:hypothetical protein
MAAEAPSAQLQVGALVVLTVAATASLIHTLLARTPAPTPLPPGPTGIVGFRLQPLPGQAAGAGRRLARSELRRWAVQAVEPGGPPLELTLVNLHSRSHNTFQLAALTSGADAPPALALRQRRLLPGAGAAAIGRLEPDGGRGARTALQSCLIGGGKRGPAGPGRRIGGVSQKELVGQLEWHRRGGPGIEGLGRDLAQLLGLEPNVLWQCLLVSVDTAGAGPRQDAALRQFWRASAPLLARMAP